MPRVDYKSISQAAHMVDVCAAMGLEITPQRTALCPFHADTKPSMHVYDDGFHCFACGAHGDAIDLVQQIKQCSRKEAAQAVAYIAGGAIIAAASAGERLETERQQAERRYEAAVAERDRIDADILECEGVIEHTTPYSVLWCEAYERKDKLLEAWEDADMAVWSAAQARMEARQCKRKQTI